MIAQKAGPDQRPPIHSMNWEEKKLRTFRQEEQKKLGGEAAYRQHALKNLKLKTVVKVRHHSAEAETV